MSTHAVTLNDLPAQARSVVHARGPDAMRFLQGLLSADLERCSPETAIPACLLTVKGKIIVDAVVWRTAGDGFALAVPRAEFDAVVAKLDKHLIMDDVVLTAGDETMAVAWGDTAPGAPGSPDLGLARVLKTTVPVAGWLVVGSLEQVSSVLVACETADAAGWAARRVVDGTAAWGHEVGPDRFPPEVGMVDAVSYDKGCFLGQEPLSRIHSRGQVNRVMVRLSLSEGESWPDGDTLSADGRADAGRITTRAGPTGLGVVHRSVARAGTELDASGVRVRVESGPLGDDVGVGRTTTGAVKLGGR